MKVSRLRIAIIMIASMMFLFTNTSVWGQQDAGPMQKGYVKTKGRMVDGKHVKGNGLKGAVVVLQGRTDVGVQNNDGSFSFPIVGKKYTVQSVKKNGYQLVDADAAPQTYAYASNPICLVMETPEQQTQDLLDSERKIRRTLQKQLQKREEELESLKETHKISLEEYQNAMQKLYYDQKKNEELIGQMAKNYASMDYDQLDSLNLRIRDAILNGELAKADSLLRSKGDIHSRIAEVRRELQIEIEEETELIQRRASLESSKAGTKKKLDDIAEDCYNLSEKYMLEYQHDSVLYYLNLRVELDTINAQWQLEVGKYYELLGFLANAQRCYKKAFEIGVIHANYKSNESTTAAAVIKLANFYFMLDRRPSWEGLYKHGLGIYRKLSLANPQSYESIVAQTLYNMAILYSNNQQNTESEIALKEALDIYKRLANSQPQLYMPYLIQSLNSLSYVYAFQQSYSEAITTINQAISLMPSELYLYDSKGEILLMKGDEAGAIDMWKKVMELNPNFLKKYNGTTELYRKLKDRGLIE